MSGRASVSLEEMGNEILKQLRTATDEYKDKVDNILTDVAKETLKEIKEKSPARPKKEYRKSWKSKVLYSGKGNKRIILYNEKHWQLTHLLEYGHAKRNGGRVRAYPHISPARQKAVETIIQKLGELK